MKQLSPNWITEGLIDFEYKKYLLLAYLQEVSTHFNDQQLYPFLSDLVFHYNNLHTIKQNKETATNKFPKKINKLDFENFKIEYERIIEDDKYIKEIESILDFAIPQIKEQLEIGKEIYELVEDKLSIFPVGVVPLNASEGYFFLKQSEKKDTQVYEYAISIYENANETFRGIKTSYINTYTLSITNTFENIKSQLIKEIPKLPNPATYVAESKLIFPLDETLLPIVKRRLVRYIGDIAA